MTQLEDALKLSKEEHDAFLNEINTKKEENYRLITEASAKRDKISSLEAEIRRLGSSSVAERDAVKRDGNDEKTGVLYDQMMDLKDELEKNRAERNRFEELLNGVRKELNDTRTALSQSRMELVISEDETTLLREENERLKKGGIDELQDEIKRQGKEMEDFAKISAEELEKMANSLYQASEGMRTSDLETHSERDRANEREKEVNSLTSALEALTLTLTLTLIGGEISNISTRSINSRGILVISRL